jgi:F0F1-type ATP synthase membrane subunit b/b'
MPQLDKLTYFTQFIWLVVFFLAFYNINIQFLLPKIYKGIKIRQKRVESMFSEKESGSETVNAYEDLIKTSLGETRNAFLKTISVSSSQMVSILKQVNNKSLLKKNQKYLETLATLQAKSFVFNKVFSKI